MLKKQFPIHYFHAHGVALGGQLTKPFHELVPSQAATAVSPVGGFATTASGAFSHRDIVRFEKASTQIVTSFDEENKTYDTAVTCHMQGVNILNQFTADEIVAHLTATRSEELDAPPRFTTVGSRFVNLKVGGVSYSPKLDHECPGRPSGPYGNKVRDHSIFDLFHLFNKKKPEAVINLNTLVESLNPATESKISKVDANGEPVMEDCYLSSGNAIHVPSFGVVYLAEYLVTKDGRQLNMFRIQLGCATDGSLAGNAVGANGVVCDPPPVQ